MKKYDQPRLVTTSWDDGDAKDLRITEMLAARGMAGTFYVPICGLGDRQTISAPQMRDFVAAGMEIGAHTVTHASLTSLSPSRIRYEVRGGKDVLEHKLGISIEMFCFPNGRYNTLVINEVRAAGYLGARTTRMLSITAECAAFEMGVTIQAFPHAAPAYMRNLGRVGNVSGIVGYLHHLMSLGGWVELGQYLFDQVELRGGVWHLYGHSWEIEGLGLWDQLRTLLDYVANRKSFKYVTNSQVIRMSRPDEGVGVQTPGVPER